MKVIESLERVKLKAIAERLLMSCKLSEEEETDLRNLIRSINEAVYNSLIPVNVLDSATRVIEKYEK